MSSTQKVETAVEALLSGVRTQLLMPGAKPEISLYTQFETFFEDAFAALTPGAVGTANAYQFLQQASSDEGVPDFRVEQATSLAGWIEVKAVHGKDLTALTGHDANQFDRFTSGLHNVLFTNGWQWTLFQNGSRVGNLVTLGPSTMLDPSGMPHLPSTGAIESLVVMLESFLAAPSGDFTDPKIAVTALASRARALKLALVETGEAGAGSSLVDLKKDFAQLLYQNGQPFTWEMFVDAYVQIATFGALLWRLESGSNISLTAQVGLKPTLHPLLSQTLAILWNPNGRPQILEPLLEELTNTVNAVPPGLFTNVAAASKAAGTYVPDPIVHAYEPFFAAYDHAARDEKGVFYTPFPIVKHIISGVDHVLVHSLGRPDGLLDDSARFLDPATGTGTFLLGLADAVADKAQAAGLAVDTAVKEVLTERTAAFELFPGPYTIAHQRIEAALAAHNAVATKRLPIYLADTLAAPVSGQLPMSTFGSLGSEIVSEREAADQLKTAEDILVIFGNPPYERIKTSNGLEPFGQGLLDILKQNTPLSMRSDLKSASDLFVAFWIWSMWALQSPHARLASAAAPKLDPADSRGVIAYITNRTWLVGNSLAGLRSLARTGAKEIWILDLGGDNRGSHGAKSFSGGDGNVFNIQTGVAIAWLVFDRDPERTTPCEVRYRRIFGTRTAKFAELDKPFDASMYESVAASDLIAPFLPIKWASATLAVAPSIDDWFASEPETGPQTARDTAKATPLGVDAADVYAEVSEGQKGTKKFGSLATWAELKSQAARQSGWATAQDKRAKRTAPDPARLSVKPLRSYWYRPLDMRTLYDDPDWITWDRPRLRLAFPADGPANRALVTIPRGHGAGPAVIHAGGKPDQHYFRGSAGGKGVYTLWWPIPDGSPADPRRDHGGRRSGLSDLILTWLDQLGRAGQHDDACDYALAVLTGPSYTEQNWMTLEVDPIRIPLTTDPVLFDSAAFLGRRVRQAWARDVAVLASLQWQSATTPAGHSAAYGKAMFRSGELRFANGRVLAGVDEAVWNYEVSGYRVLREYLKARQHWNDSMQHQKEISTTIASIAELISLQSECDGLLAKLV